MLNSHLFISKRDNFRSIFGHLFRYNFGNNHILLIFIKHSWLYIIIENIRAISNNIFWSTFNINSDIINFISINSWKGSNNYLSLKSLIEWEVNKLFLMEVSLDEFLLDIFFVAHVVHQEFYKTYFNWATFWIISEFVIIHFNSNISVAKNTIKNKFFKLTVYLKVGLEEISLTCILEYLILICELISVNIKLSFCEGTSFTNAEIMKHCTCLNTFNILYQDFIFL